MKVEKSTEPGYYIASTMIDTVSYSGIGKSNIEALERCFEKIFWHLGLKKNE